MTAEWAAVVLYYRHGPDTARTIADLLAQTVPPSSVILVDNGSDDGVCATIIAAEPRATLISLPENVGYGAAMNQGATVVGSAEWILFATHEVRLAPDAVERLMDAGSDTSIVQLAPVLGDASGGDVWSSGGTLSRLGRPAHATIVGHDPMSVVWVDGACHLVRRSAFSTVEGFDEGFFLYWEDIDLSVRLAEVGGVVVVPAAKGMQSTSSTPVYFGARNSVRMWRKHRRLLSVVFAVARVAWKALRDDALRGRVGLERMSARAMGVSDGLSGRLRLTRSGVRERVR